jgi:4-hydroxy-tetrahydrodipicolinate synthase
LAETIPNVKAIKDFCSDPAYHELTIRTLQSVPKPLAVLSTHTAWLLSSLAHGCAGVLSGSASTIPDVLVAMWDAVQAQDLPRARAIADRLHHWTRAVYITPWCDTFSRMKEVQVQLKRWPRSVVRPPLTPLAPEERAHLARAIEAVGLKPEGAVRREDTRIRDVLAEGVST